MSHYLSATFWTCFKKYIKESICMLWKWIVVYITPLVMWKLEFLGKNWHLLITVPLVHTFVSADVRYIGRIFFFIYLGNRSFPFKTMKFATSTKFMYPVIWSTTITAIQKPADDALWSPGTLEGVIFWERVITLQTSVLKSVYPLTIHKLIVLIEIYWMTSNQSDLLS